MWGKKEVMQHLQQAAVGQKILRDWLGAEGKPVSAELAQARANVCLTCPKNHSGEWLWNTVTHFTINARSKLRHAMNLHVIGEEGLNTCEVCGCVIKLKIWTPLKHIRRFTSPEMLARYPDFCWLPKEINNHTTT